MAKKNTGMAFLAVFLGWVGLLIAFLTQRKDKYVMYYAKQSLALIIAQVVITIVGAATMLILIGFVLLPVGLVIWMVLWVISWINALSGQEKRLPMLQWLADKFDF